MSAQTVIDGIGGGNLGVSLGPDGTLKNKRPSPYQFFGKYGAVMVRDTASGVCRAWGEAFNSGRYGPDAYYRPFGVPYRAISYPTPFPIPVSYGGVAIVGAGVGFGTGNSDNPFSFLLTDAGKYYFAGRNFKGAAGGGNALEGSLDVPAATDYTEQGGAFLAFDGVTVTAQNFSASPEINIQAGHIVNPADVFNELTITGGTNYIPGVYTIVAIDTINDLWILDRNCSTNPGGSGLIGEMRGPEIPFDIAAVVQVANSHYGVMVLLENGDVWSVGGSYLHGFPTLPVDLTRWTLTAQNAIYIEAFDSGCAVVLSDGRLQFAGARTGGRFGDGNTSGLYTEWHTVDNALWETGGGFVKVRCLDNSAPLNYPVTIALKRDGSLWFTGSNQHRQCGNPATSGVTVLTAFTQIPGIPPIADFAMNEAAVYALDTTGNLWAWGSRRWDTAASAANALGTGSGASEAQTTPAILLDRCVQVHAAIDCGYAVRGDGCIWGWGTAAYSNGGTGRLTTAQLLVPRSHCIAIPELSVQGVIVGGSPANLLTANP